MKRATTLILATVAFLSILIGVASVAYAATLYTATSNIVGNVTITSPQPSPVYSATVTDTSFDGTVMAGAGGTAVLNLTSQVTVTDTSTNGKLNGIESVSFVGALPPGLSIACTDTLPVVFTSGQAVLHFKLTGSLAIGSYNLTGYSAQVKVNCY